MQCDFLTWMLPNLNNTIKSAYIKRGLLLSKPLFFVINQSMDVTPAYYEKRSARRPIIIICIIYSTL